MDLEHKTLINQRHIQRAHDKLCQRLNWYHSWHHHPKHIDIHYGTLAVYIVTVFGLILSNLFPSGQTLAANSTTNWNQTTASEYTYDNTKIEFSGGVAQLKATGTPGSTWIADEGGATWGYRQPMTVDITGNATLANGYVVSGSVSGDSASVIYTKSLVTGNDFRVVYWDGATTVTDVMRDLVSFSASSIQFYFKTQAELSANDTTHYFIYYGNASASVPTVDKTQIYNTATNIALSAGGSTATASDTYSGTQVTWINDGYADGTHGGWGNNSVAASRAMIKLPTARKIWKIAQYWGGNDAGGWGKPQGTYFPATYQAQYTTDNTAVSSDVVGSAKWTSLSATTDGMTVARTATTDYTPTYPNSPSVSGTTITSGLQSCTNCFGTTVANTFNPISSLSTRFAYTNTGWLGSMGEFFVYPINATEATVQPTLTFGSESARYSTNSPTLVPNTGQGYSTLVSFTETLGGGSAGTIKYQVSADNGTTWYWWSGATWASTVTGYTEANTSADINSHIATFTAGSSPKTFKWRAYLNSNGSQLPKLDNIALEYVWDTADPNNPATVTGLSQLGGSALTTNTWYNYSAPYFSWAAPSDNAGDGETASGIAGYYVYFGTTATADPVTSGTYQTGITYTASSLSSGSTYYLRIETKDSAGNIKHLNPADPSLFIYKYDGTAPTSPVYVSASPSGYTRTNSFIFAWPTTGANAAADTGGSSLAGYQYRTGVSTGALSDWSATITGGSVEIPDGAYQTGINVFYLRAIDTAGNVDATPVQTNYYYNASASSAPVGLAVTPASSDANSFAFSWSIPAIYNGSIAGYYYSINALPTATNTTYTTTTSLEADSYANQQGENTLYLVAKDESGNYDFSTCSNISGNTDVDGCAKISFTANTSAPGIPTAVQIFDISNRDTEEYAISLKWTAPLSKGTGFNGYTIYRSTDNSTFTAVGSNDGSGAGVSFTDTGLTAVPYYYYVKAKDNAGQYSAVSSTVTITPTGRYTSPPALTDGPTATVKSFSVDIYWMTDREANTIVKYGKSADNLDQESSTADELVTKHQKTVLGIDPETIYYYRVVWIDSDGNRGESQVYSFQTGLRPKVSDLTFSEITVDSATITWKTSTLSNCKISYGEGTAYALNLNESSGSLANEHTLKIYNLKDGTEYHLQITGLDSDENIFSSDDYKFTTLPLPRLDTVRFETVLSAPTTTVKITWHTNVKTTSIVDYGSGNSAPQHKSDATYTQDHEIVIFDLSDKTTYTFTPKGVDEHGNQTVTSDSQTFVTPNDTRPAGLDNVSIEVKSAGSGTIQKAQLIVSWETDEMSTSQVEYGNGISSNDYTAKSQEDANLTYYHAVIISELEPSKLYHLRAVSKDKSGNPGYSPDTTAITGKMQSSVIDIIMNSLSKSLGWIFKAFGTSSITGGQ